MDRAGTTFHYPNLMGRIILSALEEIVGAAGVNTVLRLADLPEYVENYPAHNMELKIPFEKIAQIQIGLEKVYGSRGGRGMALRMGRCCLKYGLREFGPGLGFTQASFRLLPLPGRLKIGSEALAHFFNQSSDQSVSLENDAHRIFWRIDRCPLCWKRSLEEPACHLAVGLLQEGLYWLSGGKIFAVEEINCIARGDPACTIAIDKAPIG